MACMRLCPFIGLSIYIVCKLGTSNPVSHISLTITSFSVSFGSFILFSISLVCILVKRWGANDAGSLEGLPDIIILITPLSTSSLCQSGLIFIISLYRSTHILRLIQTIMPLPSRTSHLCSKCVTISLAIVSNLFCVPTIDSSAAHLLFSLFLTSSSSPSVTSSKSSSIA